MTVSELWGGEQRDGGRGWGREEKRDGNELDRRRDVRKAIEREGEKGS